MRLVVALILFGFSFIFRAFVLLFLLSALLVEGIAYIADNGWSYVNRKKYQGWDFAVTKSFAALVFHPYPWDK